MREEYNRVEWNRIERLTKYKSLHIERWWLLNNWRGTHPFVPSIYYWHTHCFHFIILIRPRVTPLPASTLKERTRRRRRTGLYPASSGFLIIDDWWFHPRQKPKYQNHRSIINFFFPFPSHPRKYLIFELQRVRLISFFFHKLQW